MSTITTGKVRFSFTNIFTPRAPQEGGEPKYSLTILIPKSDVATIQAIQQAMDAAVQEGITSTFGGVRPPRLNMPLYDGDGVRPTSGEPFGEECKGHLVMTASSLQQPSVVDINVQPILNQAEIYSGCYGRVSLRFFAYNKNGNKGVGCGLGNVQKLADGDPLSGRTSAADDFGGNNSYSPNQIQQFQPQTYQAPAQNQFSYQQPQQQYQDPAWFSQSNPIQQQGYQVQQPQNNFAPQQAPTQTPYQAPGYQQQPYQQQGYPVPQPQQVNPVTGMPMSGGVMGI
ncbi:MAG: hypothetical protein K0S04_3579 [Herbinix sp.]|jgi:hypothetical protein|nr:hypothetical protein [Herbinix sp.]